MLNERKVAQMAVYLLRRRGGRMSHLKLMKLLYLVERESLRRYATPMCGDRLVSMPHGPALSGTLNLMDGDVIPEPAGWDDWISGKAHNELALREGAEDIDLDELSPADLEILEEIWGRFGHLSRWELRDYTHNHCREWTDPDGSSLPIRYEEVLGQVGYDSDDAAEIQQRIAGEEGAERVFRELRRSVS